MLIYFDVYRPHLNKIETRYAFRPDHPLPVPQVAHVYAEAGLVYKLVSIKNKIFYVGKVNIAKNRRTQSYLVLVDKSQL